MNTHGWEAFVTTISVNAVHRTSSRILLFCVMLSGLVRMPLETLAGRNCSVYVRLGKSVLVKRAGFPAVWADRYRALQSLRTVGGKFISECCLGAF